MARSMPSLTSMRSIPTSGPATRHGDRDHRGGRAPRRATRSGRRCLSHSRSTTKNMSTAVPRRASSAALCPGASLPSVATAAATRKAAKARPAAEEGWRRPSSRRLPHQTRLTATKSTPSTRGGVGDGDARGGVEAVQRGAEDQHEQDEQPPCCAARRARGPARRRRSRPPAPGPPRGGTAPTTTSRTAVAASRTRAICSPEAVPLVTLRRAWDPCLRFPSHPMILPPSVVKIPTSGRLHRRPARAAW